MKKIFIIIFIAVAAVAALVFYKHFGSRTVSFKNQANQTINTTTPMTITSPAFQDGQVIPVKYTCDGAGVNPPLAFGNVPGQAQSLALIVDDPDAPNGTWTHWLLWNISPATAAIAENSVPEGAIQGQGSSGQNVWGAPCPPSGPAHHYHFKVFALNQKLSLSSFSDQQALEKAMQSFVISRAELTGIYGR